MGVPCINRVTLLGTVEGEVKRHTDIRGAPFTVFCLMTIDEWLNKTTGEMKRVRDVHRVVVFNSTLAEVALERAAHGKIVYVEGQLRVMPREEHVAVEVQLGFRQNPKLIVFNRWDELAAHIDTAAAA